MGVGRIFSSRGVTSGIFQVVAKIFFQGVATVVKLHFANMNSGRKKFSAKTLIRKYQNSKSMEASAPSSLFRPQWVFAICSKSNCSFTISGKEESW